MNIQHKELKNRESFAPVRGKYDVIVCGAGPAGIGAAIAAGRRGRRVLLIEKNGYCGGMWTAGLINPIFDFKLKKGIIRELVDDLEKQGEWGGFWDACFNYEPMKVLLDEKICTAGVVPLFHTHITGVVMDGNAVKGVIVHNKDGMGIYTAGAVIDCTGDGDVAAEAGAEYHIGRVSDGNTQPMTTMFVLGNIRYKQDFAHELYELMEKALADDHTGYVIPYQKPFIIQLPGKPQALVQITHIRGKSGLNAAELSLAEIEGRRQVMDTVSFFRRCIPQFADVELLYIAPQIGVRETRRIVGEYILTQEDVVGGRQFDDGITDADFGIDIHNPDNDGQEVVIVKSAYQIPYRCLIPKGIDNLLVAGRCISGTFEAHASYRVTGTCCAMGEAAGIAASLSAENSVSLRSVSGHDIMRHIS